MQVRSYEFRKTLKNSLFTELPRMTASVYLMQIK